MKKTLKLIPALAMLLISAILVSTSTYAWFSMNNTVTVNGMKVKAVVSDNLLISGSELSATTKNGDDTFVNTLTQTKSGILEPISTTDGVNYWYTPTNNVKASGDAINETYVEYGTTGIATPTASEDATTYANNFSMNYGVSKTIASAYNAGTGVTTNAALGYIDYVFQLKAVNVDGNSEIRLTGLNLNYVGAADASKAYRVAVFAEEYSSAFTNGVGTLKKIYSESGAENFTAGKAVVSATKLGDVSTANAVIASITGAGTKYYKVVVRLWLEGEDNTCNNETFMPLTNDWYLDLEMKLVPSSNTTDTAVANINKTLSYTP